MTDSIPKFDLKTKILSNIEIAESHFRMELACPEIAATARAGQFIHLLIDQRHEPLLRRPFTIYRKAKPIGFCGSKMGEANRAKSGSIEILFQVIGRGTHLLSQKRPGDEVRIMGPLGNSFFIPDELETAILIGGGIGIASLMMLAEELDPKGKCTIGLIGAQNDRRILCVDEFQATGAEVYVSTDDGSCGYHGLVTDLLKQILSNPQKYRLPRLHRDVPHDTHRTQGQEGKRAKGQEGKEVSRFTFHVSRIYACGPDGMLSSVAKIATEFHIPAQLALENRMACGVGACLGCVLKIKSENGGFEYKRVCTEGPVFDSQELVWDSWQ